MLEMLLARKLLRPRTRRSVQIDVDGPAQVEFDGWDDRMWESVRVDGRTVAARMGLFSCHAVLPFELRGRCCAVQVHWSPLGGIRGFSVIASGRRVHAEGTLQLGDPVPAAALRGPDERDAVRLRRWFARGKSRDHPAPAALFSAIFLSIGVGLHLRLAELERVGGSIELPELLIALYAAGGKWAISASFLAASIGFAAICARHWLGRRRGAGG